MPGFLTLSAFDRTLFSSFECYTTHTLDLTWLPHQARYTEQAKVDGLPVAYEIWPLLNNPWVFQRTNSADLRITVGRQLLKYNFAIWTRSIEEIAESAPPRQ